MMIVKVFSKQTHVQKITGTKKTNKLVNNYT